MDLCLMIEGQEDVTWAQWLALAGACEQHGIATLFRSDHYLSVDDRRDRGSLDAWATLCGLAAETSRLRLGTLVSPASFRHPSVLAKNVVTADHISGGRVELGLGAGWWEPEHVLYGFAFAPTGTRLEVLEEQVELICRQWAEGPFSFSGRHYQVRDLDALPKPVQRPRPPLILGGHAGPRSARLAARWADEYNTYHASLEQVADRRGTVREACERAGRDPDSIRFSLMTGCLVGHDAGELRERVRRYAERRGQPADDPDAVLAALRDSWIVGTVDEAVERLAAYAAAGVQRVMLQHHLHEDLDAVALMGRELAPRVAGA